jgi:aspartyl-tRNA(Asn)/glutamyl-tRNA(Gln) amidotransferase subunit A
MASALRVGEVTSRALVDAYLDRIGRFDPDVRAYLAVTPEIAHEQAEAADKRRASGEDGPLLGIPYALKDIFATKGITTTAGSRMLATYVPPDDAEVCVRLRDAGAVLLGKLNMDEFAMGSSTESSAFFTTRNPWDLTRVPGGSSGGSAAAVAAGLCGFALGTDTGGSVRQPAALCGVVGVKPTYGRVSRRGMVAFASSLDQAGPLTRSVADAAVVLQVIAGLDPQDSTSLDAPVEDYAASVAKAKGYGERPLAGLRIGLPREWYGPGLDTGVGRVVEEAIDTLVELGAERVHVSLPHTEKSVATYYLLAPAEASANLARYDGFRYGFHADGDDLWARLAETRRDGFGPEVKRRIMLGTYALSSGYHDRFYGQGVRMRTLIRNDFANVLANCDLIVGPTSPEPAFPIGARAEDPLAMYLSDTYTIGPSLAGCPAISVPCGLASGLPVGLQMVAAPLEEAALLAAAAAYEAATEWSGRRPPLVEQAA